MRLIVAILSLLFVSRVEALPAVATPPAAPAVFTPPAGTSIANATALKAALANGSSGENLILTAGTYDDTTYFNNANGDNIYCASLGTCTFTAGLAIGSGGGPTGATVQGLAFNVSSTSKVLSESVVHIWGAGGASTTVKDVTIDGNSAIGYGVAARAVEGVTLQRITVQNVQKYGVLADTNTAYFPTVVPKIYDINVSAVSMPTPTSGGGTSEACFWTGNNADIERVKGDKCAWMCAWFGNSVTAGTYQDITCDHTTASSNTTAAIGVYFEHETKNITLNRLEVRSGLKWGARCEWRYEDPALSGLYKQGCTNVTIDNSAIGATCVGFYIDDSNSGTTAKRTYFEGQKWADIVQYNGTGNFSDTTGNTYDPGRMGKTQRLNNHIASRCGL